MINLVGYDQSKLEDQNQKLNAAQDSKDGCLPQLPVRYLSPVWDFAKHPAERRFPGERFRLLKEKDVKQSGDGPRRVSSDRPPPRPPPIEERNWGRPGRGSDAQTHHAQDLRPCDTCPGGRCQGHAIGNYIVDFPHRALRSVQ